jgi:hypothetical protein
MSVVCDQQACTVLSPSCCANVLYSFNAIHTPRMVVLYTFNALPTHSTPRTMWHVATSEPSRVGRRVWHRGARGDAGALPCWEADLEPWDTWQHQIPPLPGGGPGATGHVATPEPSCAGRRGLTLQSTWRRWSPPAPRGRVWRRGARGDARALPRWEAGSDDV